MTRKRTEDRPGGGEHAPGRAARTAVEILKSIAMCDAYIERGNDVHALTAALMLPCYKAELKRLMLELDDVEEREVRRALTGWPAALRPNTLPALAATAPCAATPLPAPAGPA